VKTESLIRALAADAARPVVALGPLMLAALGAGAAGSLDLFAGLLQPRPDFAASLHAFDFWTKHTVVILLAGSATVALRAVIRPLPRPPALRWLWLAPLLLAAGVLGELFTEPASAWGSLLVGHAALHCLGLIPLLSAPPALCLMLALRHAAPARPGLAGAVAGLAAGGFGACLYALSCREDSPLFVAAWYSLAVGAVTSVCYFAGRRWLRW